MGNFQITVVIIVYSAGVINGEAISSLPGIRIPSSVICNWVTCHHFCSPSGPTDIAEGRTCNMELRTTYLAVPSCTDPQYYCIGYRSKIKSCPVAGVKTSTICFPSRHDPTTGQNRTEICSDAASCMDVMDYCYQNGYLECIRNARTTSSSPLPGLSTISPATSSPSITTGSPTTSPTVSGSLATNGVPKENQSGTRPSQTTVYFTSSASDNLKLTDSTTFVIGVIVGAFFVTPLFAALLFMCLTRRLRRRKRSIKSHHREEYEMNETPVYDAIGPELPPNHPSMRARAGQNLTTTSPPGYQPLNLNQEEDYKTQGAESETSFGGDQSGQQLSVRYTQAPSRTNSLVTVKTKHETRNNEPAGYMPIIPTDSNPPDRVNSHSYDVLEPPTETSLDRSKAETVDHSGESNLHVNGNVTPTERDGDCHQGRGNDESAKTNDKIWSNQTSDVDAKTSNGIMRGPNQKAAQLDATSDLQQRNVRAVEVGEKERNGDHLYSNEDLPNAGENNAMTFPRQRGQSHHGVPQANIGSLSPSKFSFRSLKFGSKKRDKKSRKKKSSVDGELCLDVKISSPSPTEETAKPFFSAAVPLDQLIEPKKPQSSDQLEPPQQVDTKATLQPPTSLHPTASLSKSHEDIFDDALKEPFRSRSCSQPMKQTFSPTLYKEYSEIRESWGATYLQNLKIEESDE